MEIRIQHRERGGGVAILDISGQITLGEGSVVLRDRVREQIASGKQAVIINLGDVAYMDSSGLGELISAFTTAKNRGATLKLLNLTKRIRDLMEITKLYTVFDIYDDEDAAVDSFRQQGAPIPLAVVGQEKGPPY
jgi:anti-sigma B factor antagonist